jgi:centromere protein C
MNPLFPGYSIVWILFLPPKGITDAKAVRFSAQVFTVVKKQANSIKVAYYNPNNNNQTLDPEAAWHFLLLVGDNFVVPPGNTYCLQNPSKTSDCLLSWVVICHNEPVQEDGTMLTTM